MLDVTRLRVLVAVAQHGSVTAAARALNYAQPSVSHHLARLEAETGAQLTERSGRGIALTEAGRLLAGRAEEILGRLDAAEHELAVHVGHCGERVRVAAFGSALATIVPIALARLAAVHPGLDMALTEAEPPEAMRVLRSGHVDIALVFRQLRDGDPARPSGDAWDGMRARLLLEEPTYLVSQAGGAAAGPGPPGLAAYAHSHWIAGCEHCRDHLLWLCGRAGFTPKIAVTTDDHVAAQALAAAGVGVTVLPGLDLRAARHPGVDAQPLPGAYRQVLAVTYGRPPDPPAVSLLLDAFTAAAAGTPAQ
ncbi:MAG TPA: LysR family transcriptional regulator [Actinobacteria bacterium]|nr:LysR family transcriptional regulator [Actinomycetota bacterium]